jgi:hypothetical protein
MVESQKLIEGRYYVNQSRKIMREVVMICDPVVVFITHHLETGNSCGSASECRIPDFLKWADHEATPAEINSLRSRRGEIYIDTSRLTNWEEIAESALIR